MELPVVGDGSLVWPTRIRPVCGEPEQRNLNLNFLHGQDRKKLLVTVDDVWEDDIYTEDLIPFLLQQGVINGEWVIVETNDTDGNTLTDETYTNLTLERR